jgi:hypothetical protein
MYPTCDEDNCKHNTATAMASQADTHLSNLLDAERPMASEPQVTVDELPETEEEALSLRSPLAENPENVEELVPRSRLLYHFELRFSPLSPGHMN